MSGYQYYEFCRIHTPLSPEARQEMASLSSRAKISTHGASYVYNYGNFRGNPKQLVLKHFDVFFYISNFGIVRLLFKYPIHQINQNEINPYCIEPVIRLEIHDENILLDICITNEEGFGWTEGEGMLTYFLPLYDEIKTGNYQFLRLVASIHQEFTGKKNTLNAAISETQALSDAQEAFLECVGVNG